MHEEVVPDTLQLPGVLVAPLGLHDARVEGDEEGGAEEARVDRLILEVVVQVWQMDADQPIQLVEHQFEHRQLLVEKMSHRVPVDNLSQGAKGKVLLIVHAEEQEARQKVHALAVVQLRICQRVGLEDVAEVLVGQLEHVVERSHDVNVDGFLGSFWNIDGLEFELFVLHLCLDGVNTQDLQPDVFALFLDVVEVRPHQGLLEHFFAEDFVEFTIEANEISKALIGWDELDCETNDGCFHGVSKPLESVPSFHQRPHQHLLVTEHVFRVLLIAHELSKQYVNFTLVHLIVIAKEQKQFVRFVKWNVEVAEVLDVSAELLEDQVAVADDFVVELALL